MRRTALTAIATGLAVVLLISCSTAEKRERERNRHALHGLVLKNFRVRRPSGPGADPKVGPGGPDYYGEPRPDQNYDCQKPETLYTELRLKELRDCLKATAAGSVVSYRLRRLSTPYLELLEPEKAPACFRELLLRIPVPREVFFQNSEEEGRIGCYSSRLPIESDEVPMLAVKWPLSKTLVRIVFPLVSLPLDDEKTRLLLETWSLTPFFEERSGVIPSFVVPDKICRVCLGEKNLITPEDPPPQHWPVSN